MARSADQHRAGPLPKTLTLQGSCGVAHPIPYRRHYPNVEIRSHGAKGHIWKSGLLKAYPMGRSAQRDIFRILEKSCSNTLSQQGVDLLLWLPGTLLAHDTRFPR